MHKKYFCRDEGDRENLFFLGRRFHSTSFMTRSNPSSSASSRSLLVLFLACFFSQVTECGGVSVVKSFLVSACQRQFDMSDGEIDAFPDKKINGEELN